ncbi:MAG: response regulator transcription factor [Campylobacterota bacterium]
MKIYIYSEDVNLVFYWEKNITEYQTMVLYSIEDLLNLEGNFLLADISSFGRDSEYVIRTLLQKDNYIFLLDRTPSIQKAKKYLGLSVKGYANALMNSSLFNYAIKIIKDGMIWLHPEFVSNLISEIPHSSTKTQEILEALTDREKEVAVMIADGLNYKQIGENLNITLRTVKAHAQNIFTKLNVKDRLALALYLK